MSHHYPHLSLSRPGRQATKWFISNKNPTHRLWTRGANFSLCGDISHFAFNKMWHFQTKQDYKKIHCIGNELKIFCNAMKFWLHFRLSCSIFVTLTESCWQATKIAKFSGCSQNIDPQRVSLALIEEIKSFGITQHTRWMPITMADWLKCTFQLLASLSRQWRHAYGSDVMGAADLQVLSDGVGW